MIITFTKGHICVKQSGYWYARKWVPEGSDASALKYFKDDLYGLLNGNHPTNVGFIEVRKYVPPPRPSTDLFLEDLETHPS